MVNSEERTKVNFHMTPYGPVKHSKLTRRDGKSRAIDGNQFARSIAVGSMRSPSFRLRLSRRKSATHSARVNEACADRIRADVLRAFYLEHMKERQADEECQIPAATRVPCFDGEDAIIADRSIVLYSRLVLEAETYAGIIPCARHTSLDKNVTPV